MKLGSAIFALSTAYVAAIKDQFHYSRPGIFDGPTLWQFGGGGMTIFSPDGSETLKRTQAEDICHNVTGYRGGEFEISCSFHDAVSDGKKYVWVAVSRGVTKIDVFDIDTGATVGSFETCLTPRDLEYHPLRDEIWVRCMSVSDEFGGYMDVFSAASPSADTHANIDLTGNSTLSAYGYSIIDNSLGDVGYATVYNDNKLFKIDLSERTVLDSFEIPLAYGGYEVAYSKINRHAFIRASVCCTCGYFGSDLGEDCGRYGSTNVTITTGPSAGTISQGQCGRCDGVKNVDTLGAMEFDTSTDTWIASHVMPDGTGGDPFGSPDGRHVILVGRNGGKQLRILKTGEPGVPSTVAFDLELGFSTLEEETSAVFTDFAFVQTSASDGLGDGIDRDLIIIASGTENKVAIVDILSGTPVVSIVTLRDSASMTARRNRRAVEWVVGTPYVWIDGTGEEEIYVMDIDKKETVRTIKGITTTRMLAVENFAAKRTNQLISQQVNAAIADIPKPVVVKKISNSNSEDFVIMNEKTVAMIKDDSDIDPVGIAALVVGLCALIVGIANMVYMSRSKATADAGNDGQSVDKSLGSKNVA